jgi:16S rRNA (cytosine1402-N4)-methyltransferase
MDSATLHKSVMLPEVLRNLAPKKNEVYLDATFGAGGYSRAILESCECRVYAIDRDPSTVMLADALARDFPGRFLLLAGNFGDMVSLLAAEGVSKIDGIVLDIGVSSMQIDQAERGFSFKNDGPLDMRMSQQGLSAQMLVNELPEKELADMIYEYGEERASRAIAKAIVAEREEAPITTTGHLADVVRKVVRGGEIDPATRTFQALRIKVNDELGELERALATSPQLLKAGGRLIVVTFHSLEDRIVKRFLRPPQRATSRHDMAALVESERDEGRTPFDLPFKKAILASDEESKTNPRARSAKMRVAIRNDVPEKQGEMA